jgi:hypothetical protein
MYDALKRFDLAADTWEKLATRFPASTRDAVVEIRRALRKESQGPAEAREAYARVPESSSHYKDAQKRAR